MSPRNLAPGLARPAPAHARLELEQLESRDLPAPVALPDAFVAALYRGVLHRDVDEAGLRSWIALAAQEEGGRARAAAAVLRSAEAQGVFVEGLYERLLGRAPDPDGLRGALDYLGRGGKREAVEAGILASDEFFRHVGGTPDRFLQALYRAALHRELDVGGASGWGGLLLQGESRATIVTQILASPERLQLEVTDAYRQVLGRDPDPDGLVGWTRYRLVGYGREDLWGQVLGSEEFRAGLLAGLDGDAPTPQAAVARFLKAARRFAADGPEVVPPGSDQPHHVPEDPAVWSPDYAARVGFLGSDVLVRLAGGPTAASGVRGKPYTGGDFAGGGALSEAERGLYTFDEAGRVLIHVRATPNTNLHEFVDALSRIGMRVVATSSAQQIVSGFLPTTSIASLPEVRGFANATPGLKPKVRTGSVDSQGDAVVNGPAFRNGLGFIGQGVTVGTLSDSANAVAGGIAASQATGDLPANVLILQDDPTGSDEGRAMMEIIYDIAPGANLQFATGFLGAQSFANNIRALAAAGSDVIVDDIGYFNSPMFNDGIIAQAADDVVNQGAFYVSAAGNSGSQGFLGPWVSRRSSISFVNNARFLDFGGGDIIQNFTLPGFGSMQLSFQWDQAFLEGGSNLPNFQVRTDIDVIITDAAGRNILGGAFAANQATNEAFENVFFVNASPFPQTFGLAAYIFDGPDPTMVRWVEVQGDDINAEYAGDTTIFGQPAARNAVAAAAVPAANPTAAEPFSSLGGLIPILFDRNGNRLPSPDFRIKPELTGPDGVTTTVPGFDPFFGTSAAAPHVAGVAALLLSQRPFTPPNLLLQHLARTTVDISPNGFDFLTGFGLVQAAPFLPVTLTFSVPPDAFENNDTTDAPTSFLAPLLPGDMRSISDVGIQVKPNGLPDYDVFRWVAGSDGLFSANLATSAELEIHLFTVRAGQLIEITADTTASVTSRTVTARFARGEAILVQVKGRPLVVGIPGLGDYSLTVTFG